MNKIFTLIFMFVSLGCYPQIQDGFPSIEKSDLPDAKFLPARHFTGESLFGYMNGGAELYREYGISGADITEFDYQSGHYKCEVFRMNGPEEAFGIFSVSKFKCSGMPPVAIYTCQTRFQLQICKGPYYISIINSAGTIADSLLSLRIGDILSRQIKDPSVDLNSFIPGMEPVDFSRNTVLAKGKLGLMNGATIWEDYFKDVTGYCALIISAKEKSLISVRFKNPDDFRQFITLHGWSTCDLSVNGLKMSGGEMIRLLADTHLLIEIANK
jgi:hypothetical protein